MTRWTAGSPPPCMCGLLSLWRVCPVAVPACCSTRSGRPIGSGLHDADVVDQAGDLEQALRGLARRPQGQPAAEVVELTMRADDDPEAGRVDELQLAQIEHDVPGA